MLNVFSRVCVAQTAPLPSILIQFIKIMNLWEDKKQELGYNSIVISNSALGCDRSYKRKERFNQFGHDWESHDSNSDCCDSGNQFQVYSGTVPINQINENLCKEYQIIDLKNTNQSSFDNSIRLKNWVIKNK